MESKQAGTAAVDKTHAVPLLLNYKIFIDSAAALW